jgi:hypothetical protein
MMARDVGFIRASDSAGLLEQLVEVRKMLFGLINHLRTASTPRA